MYDPRCTVKMLDPRCTIYDVRSPMFDLCQHIHIPDGVRCAFACYLSLVPDSGWTSPISRSLRFLPRKRNYIDTLSNKQVINTVLLSPASLAFPFFHLFRSFFCFRVPAYPKATSGYHVCTTPPHTLSVVPGNRCINLQKRTIHICPVS